MGSFAEYQTKTIASFEELGEVVVGAHRDVVQIERGKLRGRLTHAVIANLPVDIATFNVGIRSTGASLDGRFGLGMLIGSANRVTRHAYESSPGDVLVMPPGSEHDNRYYGGASIVVVSLSAADIRAAFGFESRLGDPTTWDKSHFKGDADTLRYVSPRLQLLFSQIADGAALTAEAAAFWKQATIEAITTNIVANMPAERDGPLPSALKIVRRVEEYLDAHGSAPIHISEISSQLRIPRRTLHRAFQEALGIGPIAFLRNRRLCAVREALRTRSPDRTIADLAMHHGFLNVGRFSAYYRRLFDEYPSETTAH
jgi:AraC-like DNA-binding protein